jgi:hypothetical protein
MVGANAGGCFLGKAVIADKGLVTKVIRAASLSPTIASTPTQRPGNVGNVDPTHSKKALNFQ